MPLHLGESDGNCIPTYIVMILDIHFVVFYCFDFVADSNLYTMHGNALFDKFQNITIIEARHFFASSRCSRDLACLIILYPNFSSHHLNSLSNTIQCHETILKII